MTRSNRIFAAAAGLALASGVALADPASRPFDDRDDPRDDPDFAKVVNVQPIRRDVRVSEPVRECWQEERQVSEGPFSYNHVGGALGHNVSVDRQRQLGGPQPWTFERCEVRYRDSFVERIDGYDVTPVDG